MIEIYFSFNMILPTNHVLVYIYVVWRVLKRQVDSIENFGNNDCFWIDRSRLFSFLSFHPQQLSCACACNLLKRENSPEKLWAAGKIRTAIFSAKEMWIISKCAKSRCNWIVRKQDLSLSFFLSLSLSLSLSSWRPSDSPKFPLLKWFPGQTPNLACGCVYMQTHIHPS